MIKVNRDDDNGNDIQDRQEAPILNEMDQPMIDDDLVPVSLGYSLPASDLSEFSLELTVTPLGGGSVNLWLDEKKSEEYAGPHQFSGPLDDPANSPDPPVPSIIYVEGFMPGQVRLEWELETGGTTVVDDELIITIAWVNMTGYRPQNEYIASTEVPEGQNVGIRRNGNEDANNLIKVDLTMLPEMADGITWILERGTHSPLDVWETENQTGAILVDGSGTTADVTGQDMVWVEWDDVGTTSTTAALTLSLRIDSNHPQRTDGKVIMSDSLVFAAFASIVIAFGGDSDAPLDPSSGTFIMAQKLYDAGYDVHAYNENDLDADGFDDVGPGDFSSYFDVVTAIQSQNVTNVAIFGYSHGGGATYKLSWLLTDPYSRNDITKPFSVPFTAYVDAITHEGISSENRKPKLTTYHVNYYQTNGSACCNIPFLEGGPVAGAVNIHVNTATAWGTDLCHCTIDNNPKVINRIINGHSGVDPNHAGLVDKVSP